jgi:hypothetical protein
MVEMYDSKDWGGDVWGYSFAKIQVTYDTELTNDKVVVEYALADASRAQYSIDQEWDIVSEDLPYPTAKYWGNTFTDANHEREKSFIMVLLGEAGDGVAEPYADYIEDIRASMRADPQPIEMYRRAPLITR